MFHKPFGSGGTYVCLARLARCGLCLCVVAAVPAKMSNVRAQARTAASAQTLASAAKPAADTKDVWEIETGKDEMTDRRTRYAVMHSGIVRTTVGCGPVFEFTVSGEALATDQPSASAFLGQVSQNAPRTHLRVRVDRGKVNEVTPPVTNKNTVEIAFTTRPLESLSFAELPRLAGFGINAYKAKEILVELVLSDGRRPVVHIHPEDSSFREFAAGCPESGVRRDDSLYADKQFTAGEFSSLVEQTLRKAAVVRGFSEHGYDSEIAYIANLVKACADIGPERAKDFLRMNGQGVIDRYGEQSYLCIGGGSSLHPFLRGKGLLNVSIVTGRVSGSPYATRPFRADVGFGLEPSSQRTLSEGKGFEVNLSIVNNDDDQQDREELLWAIHIQQSLNANNEVIATKPREASPAVLLGVKAVAPIVLSPTMTPGGTSTNPAEAQNPPSDQPPASTAPPEEETKPSGFWAKTVQTHTANCTAGSGKDCRLLASLYEHGHGVAKNLATALDLYEKSCTLGDHMGCTLERYVESKIAKEK